MKLKLPARAIPLTIVLCLLGWCAWSSQATRDTCLMAVARNISKGDANFFLYYAFSNMRVTENPRPVRKPTTSAGSVDS